MIQIKIIHKIGHDLYVLINKMFITEYVLSNISDSHHI